MKIVQKLTVLLPLVLSAELLHAQAFCALRDPFSVIGELTKPQPQSFTSQVVNFDQDAAERIASLTGGLAVNHQELGYHTLYDVDTGDPSVPGIVHVRPEASKWGVLEIAWLLTKDARVLNFEFQRCRSPACGAVDSDQVREFFRSQTRDSMMELISDRGDSFAGGSPFEGLDANGDSLLLALIRSAIKASAVIEISSQSPSG